MPRALIRRLLVVPALAAALPLGPAAADEVDDYLAAEMAARRIPGVALAVARGGEIVRTGAWGLANVELDARTGGESVFPIASLDKELTAAGLMRLVEQGRVSLDDPLARYVEGAWPGIRLRHLLSHTSGLPDEVAPGFGGPMLTRYSTAQLLSHIEGLQPVGPPGQRFLYSDANFVLAQLVIERASGEAWRAFMGREIFAALRDGKPSPTSTPPSCSGDAWRPTSSTMPDACVATRAATSTSVPSTTTWP